MSIPKRPSSGLAVFASCLRLVVALPGSVLLGSCSVNEPALAQPGGPDDPAPDAGPGPGGSASPEAPPRGSGCSPGGRPGTHAFGAFDGCFAGQGFVAVPQGDPLPLVDVGGGRVLLVDRSCTIGRYRVVDGSLDPSFGVLGLASIPLLFQCDDLRVTRGPGGARALLVEGWSGPLRRLVRLSAEGDLDTSFGEDGVIELGDARWSADFAGRVTISATTPGGAQISRFTESGSPDPGFEPTELSWRPSGLASDPSGAIFAIGTRHDFGSEGMEIAVVFRSLPEGGPDGTFGDGGLLGLPRVFGQPTWEERGSWVRTLPSGEVFVATSSHDPEQGTSPGALFRLLPPQAVGGAWTADLVLLASRLTCLERTEAGSLILCNSTGMKDGPGYAGFVRRGTNGNVDSRPLHDLSSPGSLVPSLPTTPVPLGDGTAVFATASPQGPLPSPVFMARIWIE